jgi:hypothetical protein
MAKPKPLTLALLPQTFAVCRLAAIDAVPAWATEGSAFNVVARTTDELSVLCEERFVPQAGRVKYDGGWRCFKVQGPLDFGMTGIMAGLTAPLAAAKISIFAVSTFETDYLMVKAENVEGAITALMQSGYLVEMAHE